MRRLAVALAAATLLHAGTAWAQPHSHHAGTPRAGARIGVLIMDHGEPPTYNRHTYESFRAFIKHLIEMGIIPWWLEAVDTGTVLQSENCYACPSPEVGSTLIDAWLTRHGGPAAFVPRISEDLPPHYVMPGGPGFGEPDIYEHAGLQTWDEWERMGGRSPNYDEKLAKKRELIRRLRSRYGNRIAIRVGYGIDPRIGGRRQSVTHAVEQLVRTDRVGGIVAVYHGVGFSDIMQTHMLRHEVHEALTRLKADIPLRFASPMGTSRRYIEAVVSKVRAELAAVPASAPVAIHLSGHGLPTTMCGEYDCGSDAYHRFSRDLFARTRRAVLSEIRRPGRLGVFSVYGDGAEGDDDPDDEVDSPAEGLAERRQQGYRYVIDIPYEFDSNSRDTLIILRAAYGRQAPDWNARYESRFTRHGMRVKLANASGGEDLKVDALEEVTTRALSRWL